MLSSFLNVDIPFLCGNEKAFDLSEYFTRKICLEFLKTYLVFF